MEIRRIIKIEFKTNKVQEGTCEEILKNHKLNIYSDFLEELYDKLSRFSELCTITSIGDTDIRYSLNNRSSDFEDTVQYISAKSIQPDVIVTRNIRHFKGIDMMIQTPTEFLDDYFN